MGRSVQVEALGKEALVVWLEARVGVRSGPAGSIGTGLVLTTHQRGR